DEPVAPEENPAPATPLRGAPQPRRSGAPPRRRSAPGSDARAAGSRRPHDRRRSRRDHGPHRARRRRGPALLRASSVTVTDPDRLKQAEIDYPVAIGEEGRAWLKSKPFHHDPRMTARLLID